VCACARRSHFYRGAQALAFSPEGTRLAIITTDNSHSLHIYDWCGGGAAVCCAGQG
jgi:hypothetical protein